MLPNRLMDMDMKWSAIQNRKTLGDWHLKGGLQLCPLEFLCIFVFLCLDLVLYYMLNSCISGINEGIHVNKVCHIHAQYLSHVSCHWQCWRTVHNKSFI